MNLVFFLCVFWGLVVVFVCIVCFVDFWRFKKKNTIYFRFKKTFCIRTVYPLMLNGLFHFFLWAGPCLMEGVSGLFLLISFITEIPVLNANSVDPDWTPHSVAYDLGQHHLPMSRLHYYHWHRA